MTEIHHICLLNGCPLQFSLRGDLVSLLTALCAEQRLTPFMAHTNIYNKEKYRAERSSRSPPPPTASGSRLSDPRRPPCVPFHAVGPSPITRAPRPRAPGWRGSGSAAAHPLSAGEGMSGPTPPPPGCRILDCFPRDPFYLRVRRVAGRAAPTGGGRRSLPRPPPVFLSSGPGAPTPGSSREISPRRERKDGLPGYLCGTEREIREERRKERENKETREEKKGREEGRLEGTEKEGIKEEKREKRRKEIRSRVADIAGLR